MKSADIITLHVPLNMQGEDATFHLADSHFFASLERKPILVNSCRGEVLESHSVKDAIKYGQISGFVIDCWENEPEIDLELLGVADLATPHIAGYSKDGKANGTSRCIQVISRFFGFGIDNWSAKNVELPAKTTIEIDGLNLSEEITLAKAVLATDDATLRKNPELFEKLRGDYPVRREYPAYSINAINVGHKTLKSLKALGFKLIE